MPIFYLFALGVVPVLLLLHQIREQYFLEASLCRGQLGHGRDELLPLFVKEAVHLVVQSVLGQK